MIVSTFSRSRTRLSRRSVVSMLPTREPVLEIWSAKSTKSRSTTSELTMPRVAMTWDSSLISSSSIRAKRLLAPSSPRAISRIPAFSGPLSER